MESVSSEYQEHLQPSKILRPKLPINWSCDQKHTRPEKNPKLKKKRTKPNPSPTLICTTCLHLFLNFLSQITLYRRPSLVVVKWRVFAILLNPNWLCCWWLKKNNGGNCWPLNGSVLTNWSFLTTWLIFDRKYNHVHYLSIRQNRTCTEQKLYVHVSHFKANYVIA